MGVGFHGDGHILTLIPETPVRLHCLWTVVMDWMVVPQGRGYIVFLTAQGEVDRKFNSGQVANRVSPADSYFVFCPSPGPAWQCQMMIWKL